MSALLTELKKGLNQEVQGWSYLALGAVGLGLATTAFAVLAVSRYSHLAKLQAKHIKLQRQMIGKLQDALGLQEQIVELHATQEGRVSHDLMQHSEALVAISDRQQVMHTASTRQFGQVSRVANRLLAISDSLFLDNTALRGQLLLALTAIAGLDNRLQAEQRARQSAELTRNFCLLRLGVDPYAPAVLPDFHWQATDTAAEPEGPARMTR
jgi:hypothetical protein